MFAALKMLLTLSQLLLLLDTHWTRATLFSDDDLVDDEDTHWEFEAPVWGKQGGNTLYPTIRSTWLCTALSSDEVQKEEEDSEEEEDGKIFNAASVSKNKSSVATNEESSKRKNSREDDKIISRNKNDSKNSNKKGLGTTTSKSPDHELDKSPTDAKTRVKRGGNCM